MPLLQDDKEAGQKEDNYEFTEGQNSICKMMHLVVNPNNDVCYSLLLKMKKVFLKGGKERMVFTLPVIVFALFKLSMQVESGMGASNEIQLDEEGMQLVKVDQLKLFKTVNEVILALQEHKPEMSMKLYLQAC